jgi:hypothetical protein
LDGYATPIETVNSDTTSISVTTSMGITTGDIYSFHVVATNFIGDSEESGILADVVAGSLPSAPLNLSRATTVTPVDSKISIQWTASASDGGTAILGYQIMWNGGAIGGVIPYDLLNTNTALVTFFT